MDEKATLLIFARTPVPGKTKTRLIPVLGKQGAADLHVKLVEFTIEQAMQSRFSDIELWCTEPENPFIAKLENNHQIRVNFQQGDDLGERMYQALNETLQKSGFAVLIGSDCPIISTGILNRSLDILQQGNDAVLGPSTDGGYYLIGMRKAAPGLFENIHWGGVDVADVTRNRMDTLGWKWVETDLLWDVDAPDDLHRLAASPCRLQ